VKRTLIAILILGALVATVAHASNCGVCADSHGYSRGSCLLCMVETLFDMMGGW
jgi:hypothetical protein